MKKIIFVLIPMLYGLVLVKTALANPPECIWTDKRSHKDLGGVREEKLTLQVIYTDEEGTLVYESCDAAKQNRQKQADMAKGRQHANKYVTGEGPGGSCMFQNPYTKEETPLTRKIISTPDEEEHPRYEPCSETQRRKLLEWGKSEGHDGIEDINAELTRRNEEITKENQAASELAEMATRQKEKSAAVTGAGATAMGALGMACMAACSTSCQPKCWPLFVLSAALGVASSLQSLDAVDAADVKDTLSLVTTGTSTSTDADPGTDADPDTDAGPGPPPPPPPGPPRTTTTKNPKPPPVKEPVKDKLRKHNLTLDTKNRRLVLPDGTAVSADDINSPQMQAFSNSPAGQRIKAKLAAIQKKAGKEFDEKMGLADNTGETEGGMGGGGGFSGYAGAPGGGEDKNLIAGLGRKPGSHKKNKNSKVAGMSVKSGKDHVGVGQDNIFEMIHRRYQNKRQRLHFIEGPAL